MYGYVDQRREKERRIEEKKGYKNRIGEKNREKIEERAPRCPSVPSYHLSWL
jgi:hypothetical protein